MSNRSSLLSAIRGPIMLITLGVLFAIDYSAGVPFRKTWPVLLIVAGILHLFGRRACSSVASNSVSTTGPGAQ
jgi:uncharacterized protein YaaW (UPF0174 family)